MFLSGHNRILKRIRIIINNNKNRIIIINLFKGLVKIVFQVICTPDEMFTVCEFVLCKILDCRSFYITSG